MLERTRGPEPSPAPAPAPAAANPGPAVAPFSPASLLGLQRSAGNQAVVAMLQRQTAGTAPPPSAIAREVERVSGTALDGVQVHHDSPLPAVLRAEAFAHGDDVHLGPGAEGALGHELWHVAQQRQGRVRATGQVGGLPVNRDPALEREADERRALVAPPAISPGPPVVQGVFVSAASSSSGPALWQDTETGTTYRVVGSDSPDQMTLRPLGFAPGPDVEVVFRDGEWHAVEPDASTGGFGEEFQHEDEEKDAAVGMDIAVDEDEEVPGEEVQVERFESDVVAQIDVAPTSDGRVDDRGQRLYGLGDVFVSRVVVGNDRPPTYLEKNDRGAIPQGKHTVAFALVRRSLAALSGQSADAFVYAVNQKIGEAEHFLTTPEGRLVAARLGSRDPVGWARASLRALAGGELRIEVWQAALCELVKHYVELYHFSAMATFTGKSVGRGEASALEGLDAAEAAVAAGETVDGKAVIASATKLLEVSQSMELGPYLAAIQHWIDVLEETYPRLMAAFGDRITDPIAKAKLGKRFGEVMGSEPATVRDLLATTGYGVASARSGERASFSPPEAVPAFAGLGTPSFVASVAVDALDQGGASTVAAPGDPGATVAVDVLPPELVELRRIAVSDVRPKTQFGNAQKSHTVAWTLLRAELTSFTGRSLADLLTYLRVELSHLDGSGMGGALIAHAGAALDTMTSAPRAVHLWQRDISEVVTWYVHAHQLDRATTYVDPRTLGAAYGHGEGAHMETLRTAEEQLADGDSTVDEDRVVTAACALLDVSSSLADPLIKKAYERWIRSIQRTFPTIGERFGASIDARARATNIGPKGSPVLLGSRLP